MKVLIVSHPCVTPINQQFYAEIQSQTGWEMTVVVPSNWTSEYDGKPLKPSQWPEYQGRLLTIPVWLPGNIPLHIYRSSFVGLLKEIEPDVIYMNHEPYGAATAQVFLANYLSIRKPIGFLTWQNISKQYPFPFQQMQTFVFRQSKFAFAGSRSVEKVLRKKGYSGDCVLLPYGLDSNIYFPRPEADALKSKLRTSDNEILIGYMGRIVEEKGLKTFIHALEKIQDLPWRMIVVGSGSYQSEFTNMVDSLRLSDRVDCLGYVPHEEAPIYLTAFDMLVLPSETRPNWKEQFGRVIIESMACMTPVVGSNSGEIPNLIRETGGGLVFPEGEPDALAEQLKQLILDDSLRTQIAHDGHKTVRAEYDTAAISHRFIQEINRVAHRPT